MQANRGGLKPNDAGAHAQDVLEAGPPPLQHVDAAVHELNETRINALRLIDEGSFSYVASPRLPLALLFAHYAPFAVGFILKCAWLRVPGSSRTREFSVQHLYFSFFCAFLILLSRFPTPGMIYSRSTWHPSCWEVSMATRQVRTLGHLECPLTARAV